MDRLLLAAGALTAVLLLPSGLLAADDADAPKTDAPKTDVKTPVSKEKETAKPKHELTPEMAALRDRVRRTLTVGRKLPFNTYQNSPTEIMSVCLAFGCDSEVSLKGPNGQRINGITSLCWNYPCNGRQMLFQEQGQGQPMARLGYGFQEHPGEFLAMLALSRVPPDYPIRVGKKVRKVADLVAAERLGCRTGDDLSLRLVGLSYYNEPQWQNDLGETWSVERMIEEEIAKPIATASKGGLNRLMGLSFAVAEQRKHNRPITKPFRRAEQFTADYQEYALQMQNPDGSWGPFCRAARGTSNDPASQLRTTGRVLEWLVMSLPKKQLEDAKVVGAVDYIVRLLGNQRYRWNAPSRTTREIVAMGHALHALSVYDQRVFKPADAEKADTEK